MTDNLIPEDVVNAACEAAWPEFRSHLEGQQAWVDADPLRQNRLRSIVIQALSAAQQPLTDEQTAILKECRNRAWRWTVEARVPEAGVFGGIAQDLDYLCGQLGEEPF